MSDWGPVGYGAVTHTPLVWGGIKRAAARRRGHAESVSPAESTSLCLCRHSRRLRTGLGVCVFSPEIYLSIYRVRRSAGVVRACSAHSSLSIYLSISQLCLEVVRVTASGRRTSVSLSSRLGRREGSAPTARSPKTPCACVTWPRSSFTSSRAAASELSRRLARACRSDGCRRTPPGRRAGQQQHHPVEA